MNPNFISIIINNSEQNDLPSWSEDQQLLRLLIDQKYIMVVDWKAEEEPFQIGNFLKDRLQALAPDVSLPFDLVYQKLEAQKNDLEIGESIPLILKEFQLILKKSGFTLVLLDQGNDSYYIGLIDSKDLKNLKKQSTDFWRWKGLGDLSGEVLYTVYCSCGHMNVWQVKRGEIITDDVCENCNREIFDQEGKSTLEVIKDFI